MPAMSKAMPFWRKSRTRAARFSGSALPRLAAPSVKSTMRFCAPGCLRRSASWEARPMACSRLVPPSLADWLTSCGRVFALSPAIPSASNRGVREKPITVTRSLPVRSPPSPESAFSIAARRSSRDIDPDWSTSNVSRRGCAAERPAAAVFNAMRTRFLPGITGCAACSIFTATGSPFEGAGSP